MNGNGAWQRAWRPEDPWVLAAVGTMLVLRLVTVLITGPQVFPDTASYRAGFLDFSDTSLLGHSVRPPGVTVWMALWPGDVAIIVAQALLAVLCWSILLREVYLRCETPAVRRAAVVLVTLLASLPAIACWDAIITSESVSLSTGALALGLLLRAVRRPGWGSLALFAAASLWYATTRPVTVAVVVTWAVLLAVTALVLRADPVKWLAAAGVLVLISGYAYVVSQRGDAAWSEAYGFSRTTQAYAYNIGTNPLGDAVIAAVKKSDAPRCVIPADRKAVTVHGPASWIGGVTKSCPEADVWLSEHWASFWRTWLLHHPQSAKLIVQAQLPTALATQVYGTYRSGVPLSIQQSFVATAGQTTTPHSTNFLTVPALAWFSAALVLLLMAARAYTRSDSTDALLLWGTALASLASIVVTVLLIQTPPNENGRENVAAATMIITTAVLAALLAADRAAARRRAGAQVASTEAEDGAGPGD
jgi:hypothetical protein